MTTITPTSDSTQIVDHTSFKIGDLVARISTGLSGTVLETNFNGLSNQVFVRWNVGPASIALISELRRV